MFYATLSDGIEYKFLFAFPDKHKGKKQRRTICLMFHNKEKLGVGVSKVNLNSGDRFNKEEGRKIALKNLLEHQEFSRENRTEIWDAFWTWNAMRFM